MQHYRSKMRSSRFGVLVIGVLGGIGVGAGCEKGGKPPPPQEAVGLTQESGPRDRPSHGASNQPSEAERMFLMVCAACHGHDGTGRGPASESINPKPRNYTDQAWQASVTDDEIRRTIILGGAGVGKSVMMPPNPKLKDQPEVVDGLVQIIRGFGQGKKLRR